MEVKTKPSILRALAELYNNIGEIGYEELTDPELKKVIAGIDEKKINEPINPEEVENTDIDKYRKRLTEMKDILNSTNQITVKGFNTKKEKERE